MSKILQLLNLFLCFQIWPLGENDRSDVFENSDSSNDCDSSDVRDSSGIIIVGMVYIAL